MAVRSIDTELERRLYIGAFIALCLFCLLFIRLWYLQGINGRYFKDLSENNRIRTIKTAAPRGDIFDRDGRALVQNRPQFNIALMIEDVPDKNRTVQALAEITGRSQEQIFAELNNKKRRRHFEPQVVIPDATHEEIARVKVNSYRLPGVIIDVSPTRVYPYKTLAAQLLGYTREISQKQLEEREEKGYRQGDILGQTGVEYIWEDTLRGTNGYRQVEVDARGNRKKEIASIEGTPGKDVFLTIDLDVQLAAEEALKDKVGAAVAIDPNTGEVLAMASAPSYDANVFSGNMVAEDWQRITTDKLLPLNNRAISGTYPPGSTFKLIMAVAALAEKKVTPTSEVYCPGYLMLGRRYACHKKGGHGMINLQRAIEQSCNVYFYQAGLNMGIETISKYALMLGLGSITGVGLPGEDKGIVPSEEWKKKRYPKDPVWRPWDTLPVSIGQGFINATPLQMANAVAIISNGGTVYRPHVVQSYIDRETGEKNEARLSKPRKLSVPEGVFAMVRDFAGTVVSSEHGTGKKARLEGITVGGKTGTAQYAALDKSKKDNDHAWFVSFAPVENPMIATAVLVEHGGMGGVAAAPISRQVMEAYFKKKGMLKQEAPAEEITGDVDEEVPIEFNEEQDREGDTGQEDETETAE